MTSFSEFISSWFPGREIPLSYEAALALLNDYPFVQMMAIPMITLVGLEWALSAYHKRDYYNKKDTLSATFIGLTNVAMSAGLKIATFGLVLFFYNLVPWSIETHWWTYILCIICIDFCRYWAHRVGHESRFWWATHVTHHNSEHYNWSVSFRLSWTQHIKLVFFLPVVMMGFHPVVFFICHQIEVLYQFWIHTEYIRKLPRPIEYIFTTPSHHRVHHATNDHYMDKNYGSTFIIWDRMFGTFEPEGEQAKYGITEPVGTYNPITLNFHEWTDIVRDVRNSDSLKEAYDMVFARPARLREIKDRYARIKAAKRTGTGVESKAA